MSQKGSEEHALARADYFKGLVTKTVDPVYWCKEDLLAAEAALAAVREQHAHKYENARAMVEAAQHKASHSV